MISTDKWFYLLKRLSKRMWFRASLYCGLAVLTALVGVVVKPVLPPGMAERFGADSVGNILSILATSMLAVTTFSLATMVSAYGMASQSATPRATNLLYDADMYHDVFPSIAREGAHMRETGIKLQKAFAALSLCNCQPMRLPARQHASDALGRAMAVMSFEADRESVGQVALATNDDGVTDLVASMRPDGDVRA